MSVSLPPSTTVVPQNTQQSEDRILARMMERLEQMMGKVQQRGSTPRGGRYQGGAREKACRVCGDSKHTTESHCKSEWLCFVCLAPGHIKMECPTRSSRAPQPQGN